MKQQYREINLRRDTLTLIEFLNGLIKDYRSQGYTLSVRQLYYQLVARDMVENTERSYKRVASIINDGRLAGLIDWDAIEDRGRDIELRTRWPSGRSILRASYEGFHQDAWVGQRDRVIVIVEKAALANVLQRACQVWDVPLLAARGYPSVSVVRELALEHMLPFMEDGQDITVLHLGDHDPSGLDMTRDLEERLELFTSAVETPGTMSVLRIALNMDQIEELRPPPNPAKSTDARFAAYRKLHGNRSWELDALEPSYIDSLAEEFITNYISDDIWYSRQAEIELVRSQLKQVHDSFDY